MKNRIKFAGHTMGAPDCDIYQAIELFKKIGYDGLEVRVAPNGQINSENITDEEVLKIRDAARAAGIEIACLTSYYKDFVTPEVRPVTIANLKRVAEIAALLDCPLIRLYGGVEPYVMQKVWFCDVWSRSVTGAREVAEYAGNLGVDICVETHVGSLTMSVRDTVRFVQDVGMSNVGILLDYAWVELAGVEHGAEAVRLAAPYLKHVHVKDWTLETRTPLKKVSALMGKGTVDWKPVLEELGKVGYSGYICDEYEKYWYPDELPSTEEGMTHNLNFVRDNLG